MPRAYVAAPFGPRTARAAKFFRVIVRQGSFSEENGGKRVARARRDLVHIGKPRYIYLADRISLIFLGGALDKCHKLCHMNEI